MIHDSVFIEGSMTKIISLSALVVGGGMAGLSSAINLYDRGIHDIAILTDSREGATSLYARCDHQSYYKLANVGSDSDSPYRMARTLTASANMDGDTALIESTLSSRCFYRLLEYGIPFEQDEFGAFVGKGASSDKTRRMISAGDDTANRVVAALERQVKERGIPIYENHQVIRIITDDDKKNALGVIALNKGGIREKHLRFILFNAANILFCTGGPGGLFFHEGYPKTHFGGIGAALKAGAEAQNIGEFTFGISAVRRSLLLNGAYQEALPRYVSTDDSGRDIQEFLLPYFESPQKLYTLQKLKAEQWQFDVKKVRNDAASIIDLLIYNEIVLKGRHVFLDYRENPTGIDPSEIEFGENPYDRLRNLSKTAYTALLDQDLDPRENPVEIYPSMVHHNGGLSVDLNYQTSLNHLYAAGEAAGTHGSMLPLGASMNQTQVSALRAAEDIVRKNSIKPVAVDSFVAFARKELHECIHKADVFLSGNNNTERDLLPNIKAARILIGKRMDRACALVLDKERIMHERSRAAEVLERLETLFRPTSQMDLCQLFQIEDLLIMQICVLSALLNEIETTRGSHGSHLIQDPSGTLPSSLLDECFRFSVSDKEIAGMIQTLIFDHNTKETRINWRKTRPIPKV